jgi:hypothetical protein
MERSHRPCDDRSGPVVQMGLKKYIALRFGVGSFALRSVLLREAAFWMTVVRAETIVPNYYG